MSRTPVRLRSALASVSKIASSPQMGHLSLISRCLFRKLAIVSSPTSWNTIISIRSHVLEGPTIKSTIFVPYVHLKSQSSPLQDQRSVATTAMRGGPSVCPFSVALWDWILCPGDSHLDYVSSNHPWINQFIGIHGNMDSIKWKFAIHLFELEIYL